MERSVDQYLASLMRITDEGLLPHFEMSPSGPITTALMGVITSFLPRIEFHDLKRIVEKHINFSQLKSLVEPASPVLLVGAADVLTGELKKFNSRKGEICVEAILASAAVPTLFPAVQIGEHYYWDGLFSDNPPVQELIRARSVGGERTPDEIWVIQINPAGCSRVPSTPNEMADRRNEMVGNISLMQNLELIELVNTFLREKALSYEVLEKFGITKRDPIDVRFIRMSEELQESLDYVSKLTRGPDHIKRLMADGAQQAEAFIEKYVAESAAADEADLRRQAVVLEPVAT
jgi:NTE family protein